MQYGEYKISVRVWVATGEFHIKSGDSTIIITDILAARHCSDEAW